jgi:hypothetical protein
MTISPAITVRGIKVYYYKFMGYFIIKYKLKINKYIFDSYIDKNILI